jgi:hypothetical protein
MPDTARTEISPRHINDRTENWLNLRNMNVAYWQRQVALFPASTYCHIMRRRAASIVRQPTTDN